MRTAFINGKVYTGELPLKEAFITENGKFVMTGTDGEIISAGADETVDLKGRFVSPGFIDSHMHLFNFGQLLSSVSLSEHTSSLKDMLGAMKDHLKEHPLSEGEWLTARGWNQDYFTDADRMPDRHDLDTVSEDIPVIAVRCCGHCLTANTKALELCGITSGTPSPEGGAIGMDQDGPDGRFFDNALGLITSHVPVPDRAALRRCILEAAGALNSYGITGCQTDDYSTMRSVDWREFNEVYRQLEEEGLLTVRVYEQCNFDNLKDLTEFCEEGNATGKGTLMFKTGPLKMLGDGSLGARTAYMSEPYHDDPSTKGIPVFTQEEFDEMIGYANSRGMQVAVHAIGDACLDNVLNAVEKALTEHPVKDHRHGIVHCQISRADQLERMAKLGLHIYAQTIFLDYDIHIVEDRVGAERASTSYSWKTLKDKGLSVSNGSDCPVEFPDVMRSIQCAVTRKTVVDGLGPYLPDQAFTVKEALDSYTIRSAEASFEENIKGRIEPGFLADFTVLGEDPFETDPEKIHLIPVEETWLGGKCVYRKAKLMLTQN